MSLQFEVSGSIVVGQSQSNAVKLNELTAVGLTTGSNITASTLSFLVSTDGNTFYPLYDSTSTEVTISASSVARSYTLDPAVFYPWNFLKVREGNSASAVLQATVNTLFTINSKLI
jgi:hypothetical protein